MINQDRLRFVREVLAAHAVIISFLLFDPMVVAGQEGFLPSISPTPLSEDLTLLRVNHRPGAWVNSLLLRTSEGALLVDHAGDSRTLEASPSLIAAVRDAIHQAGVSPVRFLVNTHWHGDHTAGNVAFSDVDIIAHENVKARLSQRQTPHWFEEGIGPMDKSGWPNRTFADSLVLEFENERVFLWHFGPAHTDGDAVVYFERADVVHMGDLFHGLHRASVGENMHGLAQTFAATLDRITSETRVVTGHGEVSSYTDVQAYQRMLLDAIEHVGALLDENRSMEEVLASGLPLNWAGTLTDQEIRMWYRAIYRTLTGR